MPLPKLPRLLDAVRVEVRLTSVGGTHVFVESGIDSLIKHLEEAKFLLNPEACERGLVCMFCGDGFGYAGSAPEEPALKAAVAHERKCPKNPYKNEIYRLRTDVERMSTRARAWELIAKGHSKIIETMGTKAQAMHLVLTPLSVKAGISDEELIALLKQAEIGISHTPPASQVMAEVAKERQRQDLKWGGPDHDDTHVIGEFLNWMLGRVYASHTQGETAETRKNLIEIAALAVAAVESMDRKARKLVAEDTAEQCKGLAYV